MLPFGANNLQEFVEKWNKAIPIDKWYRQKYNIPFGSATHKSISLADMFFEFYEFITIKYKIKDKEEEQEPYVRGDGNFMKSITYTKKDIDQLFDELDIDSMD